MKRCFLSPGRWIGQHVWRQDWIGARIEYHSSRGFVAVKTAIPLPVETIVEFCRRWKIVRLEVFGSVLRDDFGPDSDVDFLVTWADDADLSLTGLMEAERELAGIVGRRIDLVTRRAVERSENWLRRRSILDGADEIYAA